MQGFFRQMLDSIVALAAFASTAFVAARRVAGIFVFRDETTLFVAFLTGSLLATIVAARACALFVAIAVGRLGARFATLSTCFTRFFRAELVRGALRMCGAATFGSDGALLVIVHGGKPTIAGVALSASALIATLVSAIRILILCHL
jgi:hypothetical protein